MKNLKYLSNSFNPLYISPPPVFFSNNKKIFKFNFRYIAVTKPLKYARHKNPKRVAIMIVIVWLISFCIALPIVR